MSKALDWLSDLIFPNRCPFCGGFIPWNRRICESCENKIITADFCRKCGQKPCVCHESTMFYDGCAVVYPYSGVVRDGVLSLKYHSGFDTARFIVPKLAQMLRDSGYAGSADIITAVPMTRKRLRETGYNHSEYIARLLSRELSLPCDFGLIGKSGSSGTQHSLSAEERRLAAKTAYYAKSRRIDGKTVILCDDILTTGSTLSECAAVLKKCGAKQVYGAVLTGTCLEEEEEQSVKT